MAYNGQYIEITDFSGGYCGNYPPNSLALNQAANAIDIVISPNKRGFHSRLGTSIFNSSQIANSTVHGLGFLVDASLNKFLGIVIGTKFYGTGNGPSTTFTDRTGALTITDPGASAVDDMWQSVNFNNLLINFGGPIDAPDAPFKWSGSGNAAVLGGTPPSAYGCFTTNNRVFAYRTAANPSTLYWSIIGNAEDWAGAGSGSAVVGSLSDNQKVTGAAVLGSNTVLLFKEGSTYQMSTTAAPFPIYTLFNSIGCAGKNANVVVEGVAYWINQYGRMVSTTGEELKTYPPAADDLWNSIPTTAYSTICGFRKKGTDYDWLVWTARGAAFIIIWDLLNSCWLSCSGRYLGCTSAIDQIVFTTNPATGLVYVSGDRTTVGYIYTPGTVALFQDQFSGAGGNTDIAGIYTTGVIGSEQLEKISKIDSILTQYKTKAVSSSIFLITAVNFKPLTAGGDGLHTISPVAVSTETFAVNTQKNVQRGNFFQLKYSFLTTSTDSNWTEIDKIILRGKVTGQKGFYQP